MQRGVGDEAERRGTSKSMANNSILALAVTAGFFSNALYCIVLIIKVRRLQYSCDVMMMMVVMIDQLQS